ncbi:MAG: Crp/Fnr family transcriptional regulator [Sandaracinaceae bacterium]|nr:Crp/Fnr family transcriptional regulator [Sandaracinaceae bacterium]
MAISELAQLLARSWTFSDLDKRELEGLAAIAQMRVVRPKQTVVKKGDEAGPIFAVLRGRLKVITPGVERDAAFRILGPGDLFGEVAAFDDGERSATVSAIELCQLAVIQRDTFRAFLDQHPSVTRKLLGVFARRVRELSARIEDRAFLEAPARLAKCLVGLAERYGKTQAGRADVVCELKISQGDLGELVDATRELVNKQLRAWKADGLVTHEPDRLVFHDLARLRRLAQP